MIQLEVSPTDDAIEVAQKRRHAAAAERAVENSAPTKFLTLLRGAAPVPYEFFTSAQLSTECTASKGEHEKLCKQCDGWLSLIRDAVLSAGNDVENFEAVVGALKGKKLPILKSIIAWLDSALNFSRRHAESIRPLVDKYYAEAETIVAAVKVELENIGSGAEFMPAYTPNAPHAGEKQFDYFARHNGRSRNAIHLAADAKTSFEAAAEKSKLIASRLDEARNLFKSMAVDAVESAIA